MDPRQVTACARLALAAVVLGACGATAEGGDTTAVPPVVTVELGGLPAELAPVSSTGDPAASDDTVAASSSTTTTVPRPIPAAGNRILMIGDSILASTSKRYSNDMCAALVPLGWQVQIEAEVSRPIQFGRDVMDRLGGQGWDAGLVFLGTNYGDDANEYLKQLNRIVNAFGDVPVVLVTVSEFRPELREVNSTIVALTDVYDNVSVVDWNAVTTEYPALLREDGIHPTPDGRKILAATVARHLGEAPEQPGRCLDQVFRDDSAGSIDGSAVGGSGGSATTGASTATTVRPGTTSTTTGAGGGTPVTTVRPGTTTTTPSGGSTPPTVPSTSSPTSGPATTSPPPTTPTTSPPPTSPATTPTTSPPPTTPTT